MKITKVEIKNINSLFCGEGKAIVIDFEDETFRDAGIFAITGSTGAGKTSILDAITIALYNEVPRFGAKGSKAKLEDVVSHGARMAESRVSFRVGRMNYQAYWSLEVRKKNGELRSKPIEMVELSNLDTQEIIASRKKKEFIAAVEDITKLSYDQFLRSVLLAQGQFAAFLSAPAKEKGELLEQMTGQDIFKRIGETLTSRRSEEANKLKELQGEINTADILSDEESALLKEELQQSMHKLEALAKEQIQYDLLIRWHEQQQEIADKELLIKNKQQALDQEILGNAPKQEALNKHRLAEPFMAELKELQRLQSEKDKLKASEKALQAEQEKLSILITQELANNKRLDLAKQEAETNANAWAPKLEEVANLDSGIARDKNDLATQQKTQEELTIKQSKIAKQVAQTSESLEQSKRQKLASQEWLKENEHLAVLRKNLSGWLEKLSTRKNRSEQLKACDSKQSELKQAINEATKEIANNKTELSQVQKELDSAKVLLSKHEDQSERYNKLSKHKDELAKQMVLHKDLLLIAHQYKKDQASLDTERKKQEAFAQEIPKVKTAISNNEELQGKQQALIDSERKRLALQQKVNDLEEERKKLKAGEACPLCGSTSHPFVDNYQLEIKIEEQAALSDLTIELDKLHLSDKKLSAELGALESQQKLSKDIISETEEKCQAQEADFAKIANEEYTIEMISELEAASNKIKQEAAQVALSMQTTLAEQAKQKEAQKGVDQLREKLNMAEQAQILSTAKLNNAKTQLKEQDALAQKIKLELEPLEKALDAELSKQKLSLCAVEDTSSFTDQLNAYAENFSEEEKKYNTLESEIKNLNTQHKGELAQEEDINKQLKELNKSIAQLNNSIKEKQAARSKYLPTDVSTTQKREELNKAIKDAHTAFDDSQKLLTAHQQQEASNTSLLKKNEQEQKENKQQLATAQRAMDSKLEASPFAHLEEIKVLVLANNILQSYEQEEKAIQETRIEIKSLSDQLQLDKAKLEENKKHLPLPMLDLAESKTQSQRLQQEKDEIISRQGTIQERFRKNQEILDRNQAKLADIDKQNKIYLQYESLYKLLGGSKDAFNTYVQRLTLKNLIALANIHLSKLNQRYSLLLPEEYAEKEELNFKLVDHYQTNQVRLVDTSSGGERFIISLALALGLSDMASSHVNIESLFIDEGFGSLDSESLETVIATLSALQSTGKKIGIISHVDSLKERISTQIKIEKRQNGMSRVEISI